MLRNDSSFINIAISKNMINKKSISIIQNQVELQQVIDYCKTKHIIAVDTETTGLNFLTDKMTMFQIGDMDRQFVIYTNKVNITDLDVILEDTTITKILHNAKFDYKFIKAATGIEITNIYDTFLAERIINCGKTDFSCSLANTLKRYFNIVLEKEVRTSFIHNSGVAFTDKQIEYGAKDVEYLIQIKDSQLPLINKYNLNQIIELENRAVKIFAEIEYEGILLDKDTWSKIAIKNKLKVKEQLLELDDEVLAHPKLKDKYKHAVQFDMFTDVKDLRRTGINWDSPLQVLSLFKNLVPKLENVNGKELLKFKRHELIHNYIKFKETSKLSSTYGEKFYKYISEDNKVHTNFSQILDTGRVSSSGPNMQQIPSDNIYRNCFIPPKGWVFVSSDYSSQELNVIAYGSQDPVWLKALKQGQDLHSVCAELVYKQIWYDAAESNCAYAITKSKCKCPNHKSLRTNVKQINFGLAYGMGANKLAETLSISKKEAEQLIEDYFTAFPNIQSFLSKLGIFGTNNGYITTFKPFRRRRWFTTWYPKIWTNKGSEFSSIERASKNSPIQGSSADMTKLALIYIYEEIQNNNLPVKIVMTVHDQIDTICTKEYAKEWQMRMTELMEKAANIIIPNGLLKADTHISPTWEK